MNLICFALGIIIGILLQPNFPHKSEMIPKIKEKVFPSKVSFSEPTDANPEPKSLKDFIK